jgi:hypothetical protein
MENDFDIKGKSDARNEYLKSFSEKNGKKNERN